MHNEKCAAMHLGLWCAEPERIGQIVDLVKCGVIQADAGLTEQGYAGDDYTVQNGIAVISLHGPLMKAWSKYGGTSTTWARAAIRHANRNSAVEKIMLHIDSPGGTSAGTAELGDAVAESKKTIHAHIDDLGASAAYWAASQADFITANKSGLIGSIGTYATLVDTSGMMEAAGVKVHVVATGKYKGAGEAGTPINEEQLAYMQEIVDGHFSLFESAVRQGRRMVKSQFNAVSDGRVFMADEAKKLGLVDSVASFDAAMVRLSRARKNRS